PGLESSRWTSRCRSPSASSSCRSSTGWTASKRRATTAPPGRSTSWGAPAPHRGDGTARMEIDRRVFELYDEYCHGRIDRREFLPRAGALTVAGVSALAMAQALPPRYAQAQTISFTDERMKAQYVNYPSPGGSSGSMRGVTGFCWGGGTTNFLAGALGVAMHAGVPCYGAAPETADVPKIRAPLPIHYAETDERINVMWPAFEAALKAACVPHQMYKYP